VWHCCAAPSGWCLCARRRCCHHARCAQSSPWSRRRWKTTADGTRRHWRPGGCSLTSASSSSKGPTGMPRPAYRRGWSRGRFLMPLLENEACWILIVPGCQTCGNFIALMNIERHLFVSSKFACVSAFGKEQGVHTLRHKSASTYFRIVQASALKLVKVPCHIVCRIPLKVHAGPRCPKRPKLVSHVLSHPVRVKKTKNAEAPSTRSQEFKNHATKLLLPLLGRARVETRR